MRCWVRPAVVLSADTWRTRKPRRMRLLARRRRTRRRINPTRRPQGPRNNDPGFAPQGVLTACERCAAPDAKRRLPSPEPTRQRCRCYRCCRVPTSSMPTRNPARCSAMQRCFLRLLTAVHTPPRSPLYRRRVAARRMSFVASANAAVGSVNGERRNNLSRVRSLTCRLSRCAARPSQRPIGHSYLSSSAMTSGASTSTQLSDRAADKH